MKNLNRRDLCVALSAFAALGGVSTAEGQGLNGVVPSSDKVLSESEAFQFNKLPVHQNANGGQTRNVVTGVLVTGEAVEIHETTLPPGQDAASAAQAPALGVHDGARRGAGVQ